jgi:hypothetical protein
VGQLIRLCLNLSRAILSDTRVRRQWIFFTTLGVLFFVFGGYFLAFGFLRQHPVGFAIYLLISFAGLGFLFLFALFDILLVRRHYMEERRRARRELVGGPPGAVPEASADESRGPRPD